MRCSTPNPWDFMRQRRIVEDAKRHHVIVRPIDVQVSEWDCTLEPCEGSTGGFAVRMGLRYVKGLGERDWDSIASARHAAPFVSIDDFVSRTTLDEGVLGTLAEAGAFDGFNVDRRTVLWDMRRLARTREESLSLPARESKPLFESLSSFEEVKWDYRTTSHSPRRHPLEPMRASLIRQGLPAARTVASMKNGENIRLCGPGHLSPAAGNRWRCCLYDLGRRNRIRECCRMGKRFSALFCLGKNTELSGNYRHSSG